LLELESGKAEKASEKSVAQKAEECSGCRERKDGDTWDNNFNEPHTFFVFHSYRIEKSTRTFE